MQVNKNRIGYVSFAKDCDEYKPTLEPVVEVLNTVELLSSVKSTILDYIDTLSSCNHNTIHFIYLQPVVFEMLLTESYFNTLWFESFKKFDLKGLHDVFGTRKFIVVGKLVVLASDVLN